MKLEFDEKKFMERAVKLQNEAMEYYHTHSVIWTPWDTGNLYKSFDWETEVDGYTITSIGKWYGFTDEKGNILVGARAGHFDYGRHNWYNHTYKSEWGIKALTGLESNMRVIISEGLNK